MRKVVNTAQKGVAPLPPPEMPNYVEFLWYKKHETELLLRYKGRYLVIKGEQVIADYESKVKAWQETLKNHQPGSFIIHHCAPVDVKRLPRLANRQFVTVHG
ncbi:MAG: hypothetical protein IPN76_05465 [Saprospiraceae bacterium]|nr:hypothetical protein [Saprospiraceae bacterium]